MTSVLPPPPTKPSSTDSPLGLAPGRIDLDRGESLQIRLSELALVALAAVAMNVAVRTSLASVAAMLAGLLLVASVLFGRRIEQRGAVGLLALVIALCPWLFGRSAPALTALTVVAILGLLTLAAALTRTGRFFDLRVSEIFAHQGAMLAEWAFAVPMVRRLIASRSADRPVAAGLRGVAIAAPVVLVFALLLASADAVFAKVLVFDDQLGPLADHVIVSALLGLGALGLISRAAHRTPGTAIPNPPPLGSIEVSIILSAVIALFGAFVATQVVTAVGGADHIIETAGLTRAQYARRGFFQLLWVAGLTLCLLGGLRFFHESDPARPHWRFRTFALGVLALTLAITAISIQRLVLYTEALGLTQKRFWSMAAAVAIGLLILAYAASLAGLRRGQSWFPGAVVVFGSTFVLAANLLNPDAYIARYNLTHPPAERAVDIRALARLSDDAVPAAIDFRGNLPRDELAEFERLLCRRVDLSDRLGLLGSNRARSRADRALDDLCGQRRQPADASRGAD